MNSVQDEKYIRRLVEHSAIGVCGLVMLAIGGEFGFWLVFSSGVLLSTFAVVALWTGLFLWQPPWIWRAKRERDPYTRAISLVVSRGFGTTVRITLWWWSISWRVRDRDLERRIHTEIEVLESERLNRQKAHRGGALDV